jgi:alpha-amylase
LYLNHLRTALFEKMIAADQLMDAVEEKGAAYVHFEAVDFDTDGNLEGILENAHLSLFLSPNDGGTLFELDYKTKPFNFGNVLTRRDEVYHDQLRSGNVTVGEETQGDLSIHEMVKAKEANLDKLLVHDPWRRASLRDRIIADSATADTLWGAIELELGDFAVAAYVMETVAGGVGLQTQGAINAESPINARIVKTIGLEPGVSHVDIEYALHCETPPPAGLLFGIEFVVNLLTGDAPDRYYRSDDEGFRRSRLGARGMSEGMHHIAARDDWQHVEMGLHFSAPARLYRFPLDTVSQSEDGQERVHQGCVMIPCWPLEKDMNIKIRLEIRGTDE